MNNLEYIKHHCNNMEVLQYEPKKDIKQAFLNGLLNDNYIQSHAESFYSSINILVYGSEFIIGYYLIYNNTNDSHTLDFFKRKLYYNKEDIPYFIYNKSKYKLDDFYTIGTVKNILESYKI